MSRLFSAAAFAGTLLAFALPFGAVSSCDGEEVSFTGADLVGYSVAPDPAEPGTLHEDTEHAVGPFAIAVLLVAAAGLGLAIVGLRGTGICAAALIVATQLLGYAIVSVSDGGSEFFVGLWLTLALAVAAGAVLLGAEISTRRRAGASVWWLVALAVAVVLPPLGLVVVAIVWLLALAVRAASRALQRSQVA
jgi:hypothetical protein